MLQSSVAHARHVIKRRVRWEWNRGGPPALPGQRKWGASGVEEATVSVYRLLLLNHDGKVAETSTIESPDDTRAMAEAEKLAGWHNGVEVWRGSRLVGRVDAEATRGERWR